MLQLHRVKVSPALIVAAITLPMELQKNYSNHSRRIALSNPSIYPGCVGGAFRSVVDFCIIYQGCLVKRSVRVSRRGCRVWGLCDGATISDTPRQDD